MRSASIGNILFGAGMLVASRFAPDAAETLAFYVGASFTAFGALGVVTAPYLHFSERRPSMSIDEQYKLN